MARTEYGMSYGFGIDMRLAKMGLTVDYAFRDIGLLGSVHAYSLSFLF